MGWTWDIDSKPHPIREEAADILLTKWRGKGAVTGDCSDVRHGSESGFIWPNILLQQGWKTNFE
jgi:hypothetical protein